LERGLSPETVILAMGRLGTERDGVSAGSATIRRRRSLPAGPLLLVPPALAVYATGHVRVSREERSPSITDPFIPYTRGLCRRDGQALYVNVGLGSWFALRINCPPEITIYQL
jgi:hypothetical protein